MHWIQTIREHLKLSQEELAHYLQVSIHTIVAVENDRRRLPVGSQLAALTLFNAVSSCRKRSIEEPLLMPTRENRAMERRHRHCCRKLDKYTRKLEKMQKINSDAHVHLKTYQLLAQSLASVHSDDDLTRLQWVHLKIKEAMQQIENNDVTAQLFLKAEIAGLEGMKLALEKDFLIDNQQG